MLGVALASSTEKLQRPCFAFSEPGQPRPRYHTLETREDDGTLIWRVSDPAGGDAASVGSVCYGEAPPGLRTDTLAAPLRPARRYSVYVFSLRNRGALHFQADAAEVAVREVP